MRHTLICAVVVTVSPALNAQAVDHEFEHLGEPPWESQVMIPAPTQVPTSATITVVLDGWAARGIENTDVGSNGCVAVIGGPLTDYNDFFGWWVSLDGSPLPDGGSTVPAFGPRPTPQEPTLTAHQRLPDHLARLRGPDGTSQDFGGTGGVAFFDRPVPRVLRAHVTDPAELANLLETGVHIRIKSEFHSYLGVQDGPYSGTDSWYMLRESRTRARAHVRYE